MKDKDIPRELQRLASRGAIKILPDYVRLLNRASDRLTELDPGIEQGDIVFLAAEEEPGTKPELKEYSVSGVDLHGAPFYDDMGDPGVYHYRLYNQDTGNYAFASIDDLGVSLFTDKNIGEQVLENNWNRQEDMDR